MLQAMYAVKEFLDKRDMKKVLLAAKEKYLLKDIFYIHVSNSLPDGLNLRFIHTRCQKWEEKFKERYPWLMRALMNLKDSGISPKKIFQKDDGDSEEILKKLNASSGGILLPMHALPGHFAIMIMLLGEERNLGDVRPADLYAYHMFSCCYFEGVIRYINRRSAAQPPDLTRRESECLFWCAEGKSYWETAKILGISERTVNQHMKMVRQKLGVQTNAQAVGRAHALGLFFDAALRDIARSPDR